MSKAKIKYERIVKQVRFELGMNQKEFAYIFGRSQPFISFIETGYKYAPDWFIRDLKDLIQLRKLKVKV